MLGEVCAVKSSNSKRIVTILVVACIQVVLIIIGLASLGYVITENQKNLFEDLDESLGDMIKDQNDPLMLEIMSGKFDGDKAIVPEQEWLKIPNQFLTNMYYSQWSVYEDRNHFPRDIPYDYISNVFYCFIGIDEKTGNVKYMDENSDLEIESFFKIDNNSIFNHSINKKDELKIKENNLENNIDLEHNITFIGTHGAIDQFMELRKIHSQQNLKISMSIGGWGLGDKFSVVMKNDKKFLRFIKSSIEMMTRHDFDGIDLDWEYPQNEEDAKKMVKLLKYLRYALNQIERITGKEPGSLLLSVASPCSLENLNAFHLKEMDNYLNFWNLMCYDFAGSWSQKVDYHSNLYSTRPDQNSVDKAVKHYISKGINSRKLILGMPNYGRSFTETSGYGESFKGVGKGSLDEEGIWNYNQLPLPRCKEEFDKKAVAAWNYDPENKTFISYDNAESARIKANYVVENSLGGGMWWESCGENYENIKRSTVHNFVDELYKNSPELF